MCVCGVTYVKTREDLSESPNESQETLHGRGTLKDQTPKSLATAEESSPEQFQREPRGVLFEFPRRIKLDVSPEVLNHPSDHVLCCSALKARQLAALWAAQGLNPGTEVPEPARACDTRSQQVGKNSCLKRRDPQHPRCLMVFGGSPPDLPHPLLRIRTDCVHESVLRVEFTCV